MYKKFVSAMYIINILAQAIFTLLTPPAFFFFITWLFVSKLSAPEWIYAITITLGIIIGLISMIKFVILASSNLERLEKERKNKSVTGKNE